ncbi:hypothetical protein P170DRAFT_416387 [Aspergillus steynii IBT 23096]|uniref:Uncharacterized protein n=1 Tax=Aspergillus steynii IBT 23096 TaxID=1392250 RepID=A0A2I2FXD3_9EURO|nr:uncharacterized protein P170DRAFT_416387 [Aspergillus steynii IBT 23096]PLB45294.1 hypothetical protein P170DRAFT_416387 [Aspergillus steynii IBT 23096]
MDASRASEPDDHVNSSGSIHSSADEAPPSPTSLPLSNILDSSLDDIHIPILQPVLVRPDARVVEVRVSIPPLALLDDALEDLGTPALEPQRVSSTPVRVSPTQSTPLNWLTRFRFCSERPYKGAKVIPWDGTIHWALKGCSIFENSDEELNALTYRPNLLSQQPIHEVWIFQYGMRYIASTQEKNCYRTVRIEGLPADMQLKQILPSISGEIYCARLVDTRSIIGSNTAIVTFVLQIDAVRLIQSSKNGLDLGLVLAKVVPVNTPTYPMPVEMEKKVFEKNYTRCLCVYGACGFLRDTISRVLMKSRHANALESIEEGHQAGEVYVRFHSIKTAAVACELLKGHPGLFQCQFRFLKQSCAQPRQPAMKAPPPEQSERRACVGIWD